jgi:hypothetical protein
MRTAALLLVLGACAGDSSDRVDYPRLAALVGETLATPGAGGETGALADAAIIARGGLPAGFDGDDGVVTGHHDGVRYTYLVFCEDARGAHAPCSPVTFRAFAIAGWQGRIGMWTLEHLQGARASVTGASDITHLAYAQTNERREAFLLDLASYRPERGMVALTIGVEDTEVTGSVELDGSTEGSIILDGNAFTVDLTTGAVRPVVLQRP